ncbi:MAG: hypothetical protein JNM62_13585 [Flavobacteriales bacterium]|nr:hypothetical protein [Flavobacteriales bacterium]
MLRGSVRRSDLITVAAAVLLILPFYLKGIVSAYGTARPTDPDLLRDVGSAQAIIDGQYSEDPIYIGEKAWYPPLVSSFVAGLSTVTGLPVMTVATRAGIHLALLPVLALFGMLWCIFGRIAALGGLAGYLLLVNSGLPLWCDVGLSPHLFAICSLHGAFSLGLLLAWRILRDPSLRWTNWAGAGALTGITFLGHPSTALILIILFGSIALSDIIHALRAHGAIGPCIRNGLVYSLPTASALIFLLAPLVKAYGMHSQNPYSTTWQFAPILFENVLHTLSKSMPALVVSGLGGAILLLRRDRTATIFLYAFSVVLAMFVWSSISSTLAQSAGRLVIPSFVPAYHFFFYLKLMCCMFFGIAVAWMGTLVYVRFSRMPMWRSLRLDAGVPIGHILIGSGVCAIAITVVLCTPIFHSKVEEIRQRAALSSRTDAHSAYLYVLHNTRPQEVFLTTDRVAMDVVSPAARKLVATDLYFSNPYVDPAPRRADRDAMFGLLAKGQVDEFLVSAKRYRVTHIIPASTLPPVWDKWLSPVFSHGDISIYRLRY